MLIFRAHCPRSQFLARYISIAVLLSVFGSVSATAQTSGWYASVDGGIGFRKDQDSIGIAMDGSPRAIDIEFGAGGSFGIRLGRRFLPATDYGVRAELEWRQGSNDALSLESLGVLIPGEVGTQSAQSFMVNGYLDLLSPVQPFTPFVGIGMGIIRQESEIAFPGTILDGQVTAFGYQVMAGSSLRVSKAWEILAEAHYRVSGSADLFALDVATQERIEMDVNYDHFSLLVGLRYWF